MAAPAVVSETDTAFAVDATSHVSNYPATTTLGRLLLIIAAFDAASTNINTPTDYTPLGSLDIGTHEHAVFGKIATGSEGGGTIDVVTNNAQSGGVKILEISGWYGDLDAIAVLTKQQDSSENLYNEMVTPTLQRKLDYLYLITFAKSTSSGFTSLAMTGFTVLAQVGQDTSAGARIAARYKAITDAMFPEINTLPAALTSSAGGGTRIVLLIPPEFTGTISGTITLSGSGVSGALVYAINRTTMETFGPATTDGSGDYTLPVMDTGDLYDVYVEYNDGSDDYTAPVAWGVTPV